METIILRKLQPNYYHDLDNAKSRPTIVLPFDCYLKFPKMASNSGTGLIVGNGKRNQLYRASNAVFQPEKHGVSEIIVQKCSGIFSSVPSSFNHHQSATIEEFSLGDASSPKVRIATTRYRQFATNLATHILEFPKDDDFRHKISTEDKSFRKI